MAKMINRKRVGVVIPLQSLAILSKKGGFEVNMIRFRKNIVSESEEPLLARKSVF